VTLADVFLLPQVFNARRVETDLGPYPRIVAVAEHLLTLPAFAAARPEAQPDAE
jgi:glutathione S-transferase